MRGVRRRELVDVGPVWAVAKARFALDRRGVHGVRHWTRVRENGHRLAKQTGADRLVVELFAALHDCCRENERTDPEHGRRAADFAATLRGSVIRLPDDDFARLIDAIRDHDAGRTSTDPTIGTCWDADRLDLGRVGRRPATPCLSTAAARDRAVLEWAYRRSRAA
jgi:uncharacterized protein